MRAGGLRHRVALQQPSVETDAMGGESQTFVTYATVWASIEPLRGTERLAVQQAQSDQTHKIRMRYRKSLTTQHRILFDSRAFNINAVANTFERDRELLVDCTEQVD